MDEPAQEQPNDLSLPVEPSDTDVVVDADAVADADINADNVETQYDDASKESTASDAGDFQPIDARFIPCERLSSLILFIGTTLGSIVAYVAMWITGAESVMMVLAAITLSVICLGLLFNATFWPPIEYRHIHWKLSDVGLEIRRGVLWKHQIAIPWARAQHADVSQGPLQRMFEIGSLTIHTAGTKNSSVTIDGLAHTQAIEMRDEIIRQRKEHDVV